MGPHSCPWASGVWRAQCLKVVSLRPGPVSSGILSRAEACSLSTYSGCELEALLMPGDLVLVSEA